MRTLDQVRADKARKAVAKYERRKGAGAGVIGLAGWAATLATLIACWPLAPLMAAATLAGVTLYLNRADKHHPHQEWH